MKLSTLFNILLCSIVFALMCVGVYNEYQKVPEIKHPEFAEKWGQVPELWIDPETNCQYFRVMGGMTPRLGTDGHPLCNFDLQTGSE